MIHLSLAEQNEQESALSMDTEQIIYSWFWKKDYFLLNV